MKTKAALESDIAKVMATLQQDYPELMKYIVEMPFDNSGDEAVTLKCLEDYYNSLKGLLEQYSKTRTHNDS